MKKLLSIVAVVALTFVLSPFTASAQDGDGSVENPFQMPTEKGNELAARLGVDLSKEWGDFRLGLEEELRLGNLNRMSGVFDRINSTLSASYRPSRWFRFGVNYTFIVINNDGNSRSLEQRYWDLRHRASADLMFTLRTGKWRFSLRERAQFTFRTDPILDSREISRCEMSLRHRLKADYEIYHLPLRPYIAVELSNLLNAPKAAGGVYIDKVRSSVGLEWRLNRRTTMDFFYRFDYTLDRDIKVVDTTSKPQYFVTPEKGFNHIIGVFYMYSF